MSVHSVVHKWIGKSKAKLTLGAYLKDYELFKVDNPGVKIAFSTFKAYARELTDSSYSKFVGHQALLPGSSKQQIPVDKPTKFERRFTDEDGIVSVWKYDSSISVNGPISVEQIYPKGWKKG